MELISVDEKNGAKLKIFGFPIISFGLFGKYLCRSGHEHYEWLSPAVSSLYMPNCQSATWQILSLVSEHLLSILIRTLLVVKSYPVYSLKWCEIMYILPSISFFFPTFWQIPCVWLIGWNAQRIQHAVTISKCIRTYPC